MEPKTLFDKIWDAHVVKRVEGGPNVLYIDRHFIHEVTSPVAFLGLKNRGRKVLRPEQTVATPDHNVPTVNQHLSIKDELSRNQVETLKRNCEEHASFITDSGPKVTALCILLALRWGLHSRE
jgi:3-isopropylmalate/(R)-2-methylmalate dehydratase large subunit